MNIAQIRQAIEYIRHKMSQRAEDIEFNEDFEESKHPRDKSGRFKAGTSYSVNAKHRIKPGGGDKLSSYSVNARHKLDPGGSEAERRLSSIKENKKSQIRSRHPDPWR